MKKIKKRSSPIWKISREELIKLIDESNSLKEVLNKIKLRAESGGNYNTLQQRLLEDNIDITELTKRRKKYQSKMAGIYNKRFLEEVMVKNSNYSRKSLKQRIIEENLIEYKCIKCGRFPEWEGEELVLVLDHINGDPTDNRLENLRFLCPNCNSQMPTFAGRSARKSPEIKYCIKCRNPISHRNKSGLCLSCSSKGKNLKVKNRPPKETLLKQIDELGYCGTGRLYGVSDNAIRKWLR